MARKGELEKDELGMVNWGREAELRPFKHATLVVDTTDRLVAVEFLLTDCSAKLNK